MIFFCSSDVPPETNDLVQFRIITSINNQIFNYFILKIFQDWWKHCPIESVLWQEEGYTMKYSLSPRGNPKGSGYISSYIPTQVKIQTLSITTPALTFLEINIDSRILPIAATAGQYGKILPSRVSNSGELNFNIIMFSHWECNVLHWSIVQCSLVQSVQHKQPLKTEEHSFVASTVWCRVARSSLTPGIPMVQTIKRRESDFPNHCLYTTVLHCASVQWGVWRSSGHIMPLMHSFL